MQVSDNTIEITSASPCIGHCTTVLGDDVCRSCLRTFEEVSRWLEMSEAERVQVNRRIASLKTTGFRPELGSVYPEPVEGPE